MISPTHTISPEWQNENALRAYPLEDDAPAASVIPPQLIADLRVSADTAYTHLFISNVYVSDTLVSLAISGVNAAGDTVGLLACTVTRDELEPFRAYSMSRLSDTANGVVAFGDIRDILPCKHSFLPLESRILASAVSRTRVPGVSKIIDPAHGAEASGIVDLSGNSEFRTYRDPTDATGKTIIIALEDLYRELTTSVCSTEPSFDTCGETPVRTINGVAPTADGVLTLRFR